MRTSFPSPREMKSIAYLCLSFCVFMLTYSYWRSEKPATQSTAVLRACAQGKLGGVLLAVNFNTPHLKNIPALQEYYEPVFGKVVFCTAHTYEDKNIIGIGKSFKGWLGYKCLQEAMKLHPNFQGYMYTNDDVIINWWNLFKFDQNKIWIGQDYLTDKYFQDLHKPLRSWWWWSKVNNTNSCAEILSHIEKRSTMTDKMGRDLALLLSNYYIHTDDKKGCYITWSDVFYIPKRNSGSFLILSEMFIKLNIFLEIAVPTMLAFLIEKADDSWQYENLNGIYLPDTYKTNKKYLSGLAFYETYNFELTFIHPFKMGGSSMATANQNIFKKVILNYAKYAYVDCEAGF